MSPFSETDWHRRQIRALVNAQDIQLRLNRPTLIETAAGGVTKALDQPVQKQTFRLIPFKRRLTLEYGLSIQGESIKLIQYVLVGEHDADIEVGDWFTLGEVEYLVKFISDSRLHRTAAGVVIRRDP